MKAFFQLHQDLPREGPGETADVAWAARCADVPLNARICDAACGPGADISALLKEAPDGQVFASDLTPAFVGQARARFGGHPRVSLQVADMKEISGPYDFIWCAGAVYFLGIENALTLWRSALAPQGTIAFSQVCWLGDERPERAVRFWAEYEDMTDRQGVSDQIERAGYESLGQRVLSNQAWEDYFGPIDRRIALLRPGANAELAAVLDEAEEEAACWRAHRDAFGYVLSVVRPK